MKFGLNQKTLDKFREVFARYPEIEEVVIYGSRAKGNYHEGSDIDITLKGPRLTEKIRAQVWLDLDELNSPYLVDLSVFHLLKSESLTEHIHRVGKRFYVREESRKL